MSMIEIITYFAAAFGILALLLVFDRERKGRR